MIVNEKQEKDWVRYLENFYGFGAEEEEWYDVREEHPSERPSLSPSQLGDLDVIDEYIAEKQDVGYPVDARGFTYDPGMSP